MKVIKSKQLIRNLIGIPTIAEASAPEAPYPWALVSALASAIEALMSEYLFVV